ncbi:AAA-type ATPase [Galdieria sulphuraria]|uniref:Peroxisomal ATPase PEX6 n=1 Tax=Galdieria sulphuraria TaxID=130081 RepID=M2Y5Q7_GALSU|nr:AAA-type ATPase [Galdieria sulphuraria]EME31189.1 AAA-type ATPase [Galdieria sulphuraria]|eukprot:XP_005707709.1 AAA-type ATPase [Galdieria sulphuraria]
MVCPCSFVLKDTFTCRNILENRKWFPLARIPLQAYRHVRRNQPNLSDVRHLVFLSANVLRELQITSGGWVLVWKRSEKGAEPLQFAKILATELVFDVTLSEYTFSYNVKKVAFLSPGLFFFTRGADLISVETLQRRKSLTPTDVFPFSLYSRKLPTASEIAVARVKNAKPLKEWEDLFVSFSLKKYFQKPRLLRQGEVFAIVATHELLFEWCHYSLALEKVPLMNKIDFYEYYITDMGRKIFFFRVEKLSLVGSVTCVEEPALIDPELTKVSQISGVCSMIPLDLHLFALQEQHLKENVEMLSRHSSCMNPALFSSLKLLLENHLMKENIVSIMWKTFSCGILLYGSDNDSKNFLVQDVSYSLGLPVFDIDCLRFFESMEAQHNGFSHLEQFLSLLHERYLEFQPCALLLRNLDVLDMSSDRISMSSTKTNCKTRLVSKLEALMKDHRNRHSFKCNDSQSSSIVFATCERAEDLDPQIRSLFVYELEVSVPSEDVRKQYLETLLHKVPMVDRNSLEFAMKYSKALRSYSSKMLYFWCSQVALNCLTRVGIEKDPCALSEDAVVTATKNMEERTNMSIIKTSLRVPKITWKDIGGLSNVRELIIESIQLPLLYPEFYGNTSQVRRRSGLLFYGPPGTGKTLLAKAIANECGCSFLSVKGPELMNMYVGESEKNIRDIFSKAREASPCVVFFDELDSLAPMRGQSSDGGGVMDRVVSQLLTEMDDLHSNGKTKEKGSSSSLGVIVVGATNRPDLLDSALLRPGRFDKLIYVGSPETREARFEVLSALTRKFIMSDDVDLMTIANYCPKIVSGADLYGLCADAWLFAAKRTIRIHEQYSQKSASSNEGLEVIVCQQDFLDANARLSPSLSEEMLLHYKQLVKRFSSTE